MNVAIIGAGFGDEGKGLTTDYLCSKLGNPLVIRYSGGQQAGHTVIRNGIRHVFSNFGSGTLQEVPTLWSRFCTVDPQGIRNELEVLKEKGINPILYIDPTCEITTPFEKYYNQSNPAYVNNGTCGVGVGATMQRKENHYSLTYGDLFYPSVLHIKLKLIEQYYGYLGSWKKSSIADFLSDCEFIITHNENIKLSTELKNFNHYDHVYEGSQGLLLDQNHGFFPHVTRSNTGITNIIKLEDNLSSIYLVTRAYQTRHGHGPMTNEEYVHNIKENPEETNVSHQWQGDFRRSILDLDLLLYAIERHQLNKFSLCLVITCLDHVENNLSLTYTGRLFNSFKSENEFVEMIQDVLKTHFIQLIRSPKAEDIDN